MTTLAELDRLLRTTLRLWRRGCWRLGAWFCLGFAGHVLGLEVSAILGAEHDLGATLAFVAGLTASLLASIAMINTLRPELRGPAILPDPEPFLGMITATLGPFLAVYAVWGLVENEARTLFRANVAERGLGGVTEWSISWAPERLPFYATLLVGSWLARFVVLRFRRRVGGDLLAALGVAAEVVLVFATFATLIIAGQLVRDWLGTRVVVVAIEALWPFDVTIPALLAAIGTKIALPLMWLALATVVFGWRAFEVPVPRHPLVRSVVLFATEDLRTKYVPVLRALRLVLTGGPRLIGAYLVLATVLGAVQDALVIGISVLIGPTGYPLALALDPGTELLAGLVVMPLLICLYVAVIDRALTTAADPSGRARTARPPTPDPAPLPAPGS